MEMLRRSGGQGLPESVRAGGKFKLVALPFLLAACAAQVATPVSRSGPAHAPGSQGTPARPDGPDQSDVLHAQQVLLNSGPSDAGRAVTLYRRAAARGNALAEYNLGFCYESGMGVTADKTEAAAWYRKAAVNRNSAAVRRMARARLQTLSETAASEVPNTNPP